MVATNSLICFIGADGSGKTSHAEKLCSYLQERGYASKYVWAASRPLLVYPFLFLTRGLGYWSEIRKGAYTDPLEKAPSRVRKNLGKIYRTLLFVDFLTRSLVKVRLTLLFEDVVICDRFAYDLLMELDLSGLRSAFFEKMVLYMAGNPQIGFFVNAPAGLITQRRPEFAAANIRAKQHVYQKLARVLGFRTVDTHRSFDENQEYIIKETLLAIASTV